MTYRIPKYVDLPFGYTVNIVQLPHGEYVDENGDDSVACWDVCDKTVYLDKSRPIRKRRADLAHEIGHAFMDWQCEILGKPQTDVKG